MEAKSIKFEIKNVNETEGTFEGIASAYRKTPDKTNDIVKPGAFKKTVAEHPEVPGFFMHDIMLPICKFNLSEGANGLNVKGSIVRGVQKAEETLLLMKAGVIKTLSIGYDAIQKEFKDGIRYLTEVRVHEVSVVVGDFAADDMALITAVKTAGLETLLQRADETTSKLESVLSQLETKPYPNEHACRLRNPDDFKEGSFRRTTRDSDGKKYSVIMGKLTGEDDMTEQAYRYDKDVWDADEARAHCESHDGSFEAAEKTKADDYVYVSNEDGGTTKIALPDKGAVNDTPDDSEAADILSALQAFRIDFDPKKAEDRIEELLSKL